MQYSLEPVVLTKELILSKVSEEQLFEHYGVPIQKGLFRSPLRNDAHPTVSIYRNKAGRLIMKDFGSDFCSDVFGFVEAKFNVGYQKALQIIANDFGIISMPKLIKNKPKIEYTGTKIQKSTQSIIRVEVREWDESDINWWNNYGISVETLHKFKVYPCKTAWLNENLIYLYNSRQKVYGYFGGIKSGVELWRLYFPGRKKYKFVSNWKSSLIQGAHMLPDFGDFIVISKAQKDVMCLYEFGIPAIAPCSENEFLSEAQYKKIKSRFNKIYVLYDLDGPGIQASKKIKRDFPEVQILLLPRKYECKDFSDFIKKYGKNKALELINTAKKYYGES